MLKEFEDLERMKNNDWKPEEPINKPVKKIIKVTKHSNDTLLHVHCC